MSGFLADTSLSADPDLSSNAAATFKDRDKLVTELKKENFNLKLRIYHMEETISELHQGRWCLAILVCYAAGWIKHLVTERPQGTRQ